ncbi:MAG: prepilin-type N-terminal cleavage/methylation domain-containing protein [Candidatus Moraniibacteriota bacterium]|nr:MAG: prepilin-type N-terminal cleavage/methylation domain-containing protein [Candidatus Moranbacteria bacterium]
MKKTKKGMTLIEVIVAIGVFSIGMGLAVLLFVQSWNMYKISFSTGSMQFVASNGVQRIIDSIRNAQRSENGSYPIVSVDENEIILYSNVDDDEEIEKIRFFYSGSGIVREVRNSVFGTPPQYPAGYEISEEIIPYVINTADTPLFSYYNNENEKLTEPISLIDVKMVKVDLYVDENINRDPESINIESFASIRNLSQYEISN